MFRRVYVCKVRDQIDKIGNSGACFVLCCVVQCGIRNSSLHLSLPCKEVPFLSAISKDIKCLLSELKSHLVRPLMILVFIRFLSSRSLFKNLSVHSLLAKATARCSATRTSELNIVILYVKCIKITFRLFKKQIE